ncbi:MAG: 4-vinyl reductase [Anaerolineae bacterium]|nr:4-vinyl reductase [Anaerolineae bacterium]
MATTERQKSGFYYPNKFARIAMEAMEEIMGRNGLNTILRMARLEQFTDTLPPDNLDKIFDFSDFTALNIALEEMFGPRGGRAMALRAGRKLFAGGLRSFGALAGVGDLAFKVLPLSAKLKVGVPAMANIFTQFSDQISNAYDDGPDRIIYTMEKRCALCWNRTADRAVCFMGQGLLMEGLKWVSGGREFKVDMSTCIAKGDDMSRFIIYKEPVT